MTVGQFAPLSEMTVTNGAGLMYDNFTVKKVPYHLHDPLPLRDTVICGSPFALELATTGRHAAYRWSTGDSTAAITVTAPGEYVVEAVLDNECSIFDTVRVTLLDPATFSLGADTTLCPEALPFTLRVPSGEAAYTWNTGHDRPELTVDRPGDYWVAVDSRCGPLRDTIGIATVHPPTPLLSGDTTFCELPPMHTLRAASGFDSYIWNGAVGGTEYPVADTGRYTLVATSYCGSYSAEIRVDYQPTLHLDLASELLTCAPEALQLRAIPGFAHYRWSTGDTTALLEPGDYGVYTLAADYACGSDTATVRVRPPTDEPQITLPPYETVDLGAEFTFRPRVAAGGTLQYAWAPPEGLSCYDCPQPTASPQQSTTYTLTVTDEYGCQASASSHLIVRDRFDYYAPTGVSPNRDGHNDGFVIRAGPQVAAVEELLVYDRWGGLVHRTAGGHWAPDERYPQGVYPWVARLVLLDGSRRTVWGEVTLLR